MTQSGNMVFTGGGWVIDHAAKNHKRSKIIDAHYHIFPRLSSQRQGIAPELRLKFWQFHSREYNNFWRKDDGTHVVEPFLQFNSNDLDDMPQVDFRLTDYGQAEITVDGVDYIMQLFPPNLVNNEAPPQRMVAEMNLAEVDVGILQSDHAYGDLNEYFGQAMKDYPGRFVGLAQIWEPEADDPKRLQGLERGIREHGNKGLYFSVEPFSLSQQDTTLNDPQLDPLWSLVEKLEIPIFWYLDDRTIDRVAMFMRRIAELDEWARRHPGIPSLITHGLVPAAIIHEIGLPEEVVALLDHPHVFAEILFPAKSPDYPYPTGQRQLEHLRDRVGAEKLLWGSDSPVGMTMWCTYRQSLDFIRLHCDFLSQDEKDLILGGNAAGLFGIEPFHTK
jgi:predicted TIM-barrel fold metal-dependent hydrolase